MTKLIKVKMDSQGFHQSGDKVIKSDSEPMGRNVFCGEENNESSS
jgi:hypothetical protein